MLESALNHYRRQQRLTVAGLLAARVARKRSTVHAASALAAMQLAVARDAIAGVDEMLEEQAIDAPSAGAVVASSLVGTASDGRPLESLLTQARNEVQFGLMVVTQMQDAARGAASISIAARPRLGYVRMLNPPSCSRCAVLAGRFYKWNAGFERHPRCDCRHIPSTEALSSDLTTNPHEYFESLPTAEHLADEYPDLTVKMRNELGIYSQEDIFTKAGARAIRDGADLNQIVNARRGMSKAQVFGKDALVTSEGTTRRGLAYQSLSTGRLFDVRDGTSRYARSAKVRLMPESIYQYATDRTDAIRLLRLNGYIT